MKIQVLSFAEVHDGRGPRFEVDDVRDYLRVRVQHEGAWYDLAVEGGKLKLSAVGGPGLVLRPEASNLMVVDVDDWAKVKPKKKPTKRTLLLMEAERVGWDTKKGMALRARAKRTKSR